MPGIRDGAPVGGQEAAPARLALVGDRWGMTDDEVARPYPCHEFVTTPPLQARRGVDVHAPAEAVSPWVASNRHRCRVWPSRGSATASPPAQPPAGPERLGRRGKLLTGATLGAYMLYVVVPKTTYAPLLKIVKKPRRRVAVGASVGDQGMARRQLLNFKRLTERHQR